MLAHEMEDGLWLFRRFMYSYFNYHPVIYYMSKDLVEFCNLQLIFSFSIICNFSVFHNYSDFFTFFTNLDVPKKLIMRIK